MLHAREDYNRIQDPLNKIPADEPVLLFRAQDKYARHALLEYIKVIRNDPTATPEALEVANTVARHERLFVEWETKKTPDL